MTYMIDRYQLKFFKGHSLRMLLSFFMALCFFSNIIADDNKADLRVYTKDEFVDTFLENAGIVDSLRHEVEAAQADYDIVLAQYFPKIKVTFGIGPHPKYEYKAMELKTDENGKDYIEHDNWNQYTWDFSEYGVAVRTKGQFTMPIYTFGKFMNGLDAAKAGIAVSEAQAQIGQLKLRKEAATYYWSWVMANEMLDLMKPAVKKVEEAEEKLKKMLYEEKESVSQKDLIKLRIEKEKLLYRFKGLELQHDTLKTALNKILGENWKIADSRLTKQLYQRDYDSILSYMSNESPYRKYLKSGLSALENLYEYEVCNLFPDFGMMGYFEHKYTSSVYENDYPYANSPYNGWDGELGIGLTININFIEQGRKIQKAKAKWKAMKAKASFMEKSVPVLIRKKYNELKALEFQVKHVKNARKYAKGWMTMEFSNSESGFNNTNDLIDAVKAYFENEYLYLNSIYEYNMKVEDIIESTGAR